MEVIKDTKDILVGQLKALRPAFISKKPHFNFISAHCEYFGDPAYFGVRRNCLLTSV
jgi:hypothetical protein